MCVELLREKWTEFGLLAGSSRSFARRSARRLCSGNFESARSSDCRVKAGREHSTKAVPKVRKNWALSRALSLNRPINK